MEAARGGCPSSNSCCQVSGAGSCSVLVRCRRRKIWLLVCGASDVFGSLPPEPLEEDGAWGDAVAVETLNFRDIKD